MINYSRTQPIAGYHFVNYLINNNNNKGKTMNGRFTISLVNKPKSYETVTWAPRCLVPTRKVFRIAHPALRNKYFKIEFNFYPPTHYKKPMFYVMVEKLLGIKI